MSRRRNPSYPLPRRQHEVAARSPGPRPASSFPFSDVSFPTSFSSDVQLSKCLSKSSSPTRSARTVGNYSHVGGLDCYEKAFVHCQIISGHGCARIWLSREQSPNTSIQVYLFGDDSSRMDSLLSHKHSVTLQPEPRGDTQPI